MKPLRWNFSEKTFFITNMLVKMAIDKRIGDGKLQYHTYKEAANISALLSGKTNAYEYPIKDELKRQHI